MLESMHYNDHSNLSMNITILANRDIASNFAINNMLEQLAEHKISIFLSSKVGGKADKPEELQRLKFFEQDLFNQIISPLMNKAELPSSKYLSFAQISDKLEGRVAELNNINCESGLDILATQQPELIVSIRFGVIIKADVIAIPKHGVINLHSGVLPNYRGVMASFWALLNDEPQLGTTLHFINDATIDTGEIIATSLIKAQVEQSYLWHVLELYKQGAQLIIETIQKISNDQPLLTYPQATAGNYYTFPKQVDLDNFKNAGKTLVAEAELMEFLNHYYL
ncbi:formyl transferase [Colwelliaceae bacterium BS250]